MAKIIARGTRGDIVNLYVRLKKSGVINNAIALGISIKTSDWVFIEKLLNDAAAASRAGIDVTIRDSLAMELWDIQQDLEAMITKDGFTVNIARSYVADYFQRKKERDTPVAEEKPERNILLCDWIEEFIRQCETGERLKQKSAAMITPGTIKSYKGTLQQLRNYEEHSRRRLGFDDMTLDFYDAWTRYFIHKTDKAGNARPYSPNTIGRHVKNLKIFLYAAKDMKMTTTSDFESSRFAVISQDVDNVYLTDERVQEMYEVDFEDDATINRLLEQASKDDRKYLKDQLKRRTPKLLNEAKDIFVVGCLTGQRVSDYKRINSDMIKTLSDGDDYIYLRQTKTGKWLYIPLDMRVRAILAKYGGKLPHIYDQDLNVRIKIVGQLLGWCENAGIREHHGMMEAPSNKKFYEAIKTHTARRTFATNAYKHKVSLSSIMVITGHSSEAMLKKYLKLDNEEKAMIAGAELARTKDIKLKIAQ